MILLYKTIFLEVDFFKAKDLLGNLNKNLLRRKCEKKNFDNEITSKVYEYYFLPQDKLT